MKDPVKSIAASVAGHLALDPHCGQAVPFDIVKPFGARCQKCRLPTKARFARIHTADRLAMMQLAAKTWLAGEPPKRADVHAVVDNAISRLVPDGPKGLTNAYSSDVWDYFLLGGKGGCSMAHGKFSVKAGPSGKTKVAYKVARLKSTQKRELAPLLGQLLDTVRAECVPQPETLPPAAADEEPFDPNNEEDTRERTEGTTTQRDGEFRESVIAAYAGKCAITGCSILAVLEAAHIIPYRGAHTDKMSNGLLLRVDLHRLFDRKLLAIDPETMKVLLAPRIEESEYKKWCGCRVRPPENLKVQPNIEALRKHLEACRNAWRE